jgi:hypothetical protein
MNTWLKIVGTLSSYFRLGLTGPRLKDSSGNLVVRNSGDSADAAITASAVNVSGNSVVINSDAAESGADYKYTLSRPSSGMSANVTLTLPVDDGSSGQVLVTDGSGNLSFTSAGNTAPCVTVNSTTVAYNTSSPVSALTLPANAVVHSVDVIVDTAFVNGSPSMSVGISGTTSKYLGTTDVDLTAAAKTRFTTFPNEVASGSTEAIIVTLNPDTCDAGEVRVQVNYSVPA